MERWICCKDRVLMTTVTIFEDDNGASSRSPFGDSRPFEYSTHLNNQ